MDGSTLREVDNAPSYKSGFGEDSVTIDTVEGEAGQLARIRTGTTDQVLVPFHGRAAAAVAGHPIVIMVDEHAETQFSRYTIAANGTTRADLLARRAVVDRCARHIVPRRTVPRAPRLPRRVVDCTSRRLVPRVSNLERRDYSTTSPAW